MLRLNTIKHIFYLESGCCSATHSLKQHYLADCCICSNITPTGRQMCDRSGCSVFGRMSLSVQLSHTEQSRINLMSCSSRHIGWLGKVCESTDGHRDACLSQTDRDVILKFITDPQYPPPPLLPTPLSLLVTQD